MSTLLVGDPTSTYTATPDTINSGSPVGHQFTGLATGTVDTLMFYVTSADATVTSVELGVYLDTAGVPTTLLGSGVSSGLPSPGSWITVTGLSIPITASAVYWLVHLSQAGTLSQGVHWNLANSAGGTLRCFVDTGGTTETLVANFNPWTTTPTVPSPGLGPVGFQALGTQAGVAGPQPLVLGTYIMRGGG